RLRELVLVAPAQLLEAHLEVLEVLAPVRRDAASLHDRVLRMADGRRLVADVRDRRELLRLEGDLDAALEIDPEVEAAHAEREGADQDDGARDREPRVAAAHEVELQEARALRV